MFENYALSLDVSFGIILKYEKFSLYVGKHNGHGVIVLTDDLLKPFLKVLNVFCILGLLF